MVKEKAKEKYDYFPFISGELLEKHRKVLGQQIKADLQNFIEAKSQGMATTGYNPDPKRNRMNQRVRHSVSSHFD